MRNIYFVRHGQSEWNLLKKIQGQANAPLTELGKKQGDLVAKKFKDIEIDRIYSSDLDRAYITANKIAKLKGLDVIVKEDLKEMSFGIWEGMFIDQVIKTYPEDYNLWIQSPDKLKIPEGESLDELGLRMKNIMNNILEESTAKNIVIVSHGTSLKTLILNMLGIDSSFYKNLTMGNTSVSKVEIRDYNNVLVTYNDTSHLEELNNEK